MKIIHVRDAGCFYLYTHNKMSTDFILFTVRHFRTIKILAERVTEIIYVRISKVYLD